MSDALVCSGLTKAFGEHRAVDDLSLTIPAGSFFGICGPNGAGKTTMLRMATGLLKPDSGTVAVDGIDVWAEEVEVKRHFGFVPDNPRLFDRLTGPEQLQYIGMLRGMDEQTTRTRAADLLHVLDLDKDAGTLIADYSLGMTKRIGLASAVLHAPKVLILDEPFGSLDPVNTQVMEEMLNRHRAAGGTVVFSSHVMDVVERLCDRIVIIDHGAVRAEGTVAEVAGGKRLQEAFFDLVGGRDLDEGSLGWLGSSSG